MDSSGTAGLGFGLVNTRQVLAKQGWEAGELLWSSPPGKTQGADGEPWKPPSMNSLNFRGI